MAGMRVVITGGARGIGYGLARAFLERGASVVISGRRPETIEKAVRDLAAESDSGRIGGERCDVTSLAQVQGLWDYAVERMGGVDIWINNAGIGQGVSDLDAMDGEFIASIVDTNCRGALFGCKVALSGMKRQGQGAIYNVEGLGSKGPIIRGMTVYAATKRALSYITDSVALETRGTGVLVGALLPGMTVTDLITAQYEGKPQEWARVRGIFNILSDRVETVCPWLVERMLANRKNGVRFNWLGTSRTLGRFLSAPFVKRSVYPASLDG